MFLIDIYFSFLDVCRYHCEIPSQRILHTERSLHILPCEAISD